MLPAVSLLDPNTLNYVTKPIFPEILESMETDEETLNLKAKENEQKTSKEKTCEVCSDTLSSLASYYVHMKKHSGHKPYKCHICEASFSRKPYLSVHLRSHTGEKPFQCEYCTKKFTQKSSLNTHKRTHTGAKPYQCEVCEKSFSVKSYLTSHQWSHYSDYPLTCDECKVTFTSKTRFALHMKNHINKNAHCEWCGKSFAKDTSLIRHINKFHANLKNSQKNIN